MPGALRKGVASAGAILVAVVLAALAPAIVCKSQRSRGDADAEAWTLCGPAALHPARVGPVSHADGLTGRRPAELPGSGQSRERALAVPDESRERALAVPERMPRFP
jgi:hypothetical protein